ncbi:MAG: MarC family protein [Phycisphaerae bacterium]|nr:MarC family protein [Phycisphaerae bacterium]
MAYMFLDIFTKVFVLLSPFFSVSMFLMLSRGLDPRERRRCAWRTSIAILVISFIVYFFGNLLFKILGITVQAFQVGAGTLLFLSAIGMVTGKRSEINSDPEEDFAIVPLAIPLIVGPGTIGTLLVLGMEITTQRERLVAAGAIFLATSMISVFLLLADPISRLLGRKGLQMMMKLTGLLLTAMAAQIVFTGVRTFLNIPTLPSLNP